MIFVTVGAQMPFDRLIGWVDDWAFSEGRDDVVAQIGPSDFEPRKLKILPFLEPPEFRKTLQEAECIVAHAGMGSILSALELGKPILVVPRLGSLSETRNDHQVASADRLAADGLILQAKSRSEFGRGMTELLVHKTRHPHITAHASNDLLNRVREFAVGERWAGRSGPT